MNRWKINMWIESAFDSGDPRLANGLDIKLMPTGRMSFPVSATNTDFGVAAEGCSPVYATSLLLELIAKKLRDESETLRAQCELLAGAVE